MPIQNLLWLTLANAREMLRGRSTDMRQALKRAIKYTKISQKERISPESFKSILVKSAEEDWQANEHVRRWPRDVLIAQIAPVFLV